MPDTDERGASAEQPQALSLKPAAPEMWLFYRGKHCELVLNSLNCLRHEQMRKHARIHVRAHFVTVSALLISLKCFGLKITRGWKIHGACIYSFALALTLHHVSLRCSLLACVCVCVCVSVCVCVCVLLLSFVLANSVYCAPSRGF